MHSLSPATLVGLGAVAIWSTLALTTVMTGKVPPLLATALSFSIGGTLILGIAAFRGRLHLARPHLPAFLLGLYGPFGDTIIYFAALKIGPPAAANLIHYLWPLLIVLFAALLPGGRLTLRHLVGALMGLAALLLLVGDKFAEVSAGGGWAGYALALLGALVWSSYSVMTRLVAGTPTESLGTTLLFGGALAFLLHGFFEPSIWPSNAVEWAGILMLGLGSQGLALISWDIGMKRGDVAFLGVASYSTPVLSTITLVLAGYAVASWQLALACALIVAGAFVARPR